MKTAQEMYDFCKEKKFGQGQSQSWALKHFSLVEKTLSADEDALFCFIGLHNYVSPTKHNNNFAYAITKKRIIMAQKGLVGETLQSVFLDNVNDITFKAGLIFGIITFDTIKETFNVGLDKVQAANINSEIHDLIHELKQKPTVLSASPTNDPTVELKKYKELLDTGVITQEDFDAKKKQLLNL
jgi:hypothetical protein